MTDQADLLAQFSSALTARAELAKNAVVAIRRAHGRHIMGMVWGSVIVVTPEQSLPRNDDFELVAEGGSVITARIAGRDPSTNSVILGPAEQLPSPSIVAGEAHTGAIGLAIGADGTGGASARLGLGNLARAEWHSSRGGLIDRRIVLDVSLSPRGVGGPVFVAPVPCLATSTLRHTSQDTANSSPTITPHHALIS